MDGGLKYMILLQEERMKRHNTESLMTSGKDGFMEVYVSAVEHPGHFWVQASSFTLKHKCFFIQVVSDLCVQLYLRVTFYKAWFLLTKCSVSIIAARISMANSFQVIFHTKSLNICQSLSSSNCRFFN